MNYGEESLKLHKEARGKLEIRSKVPVRDQHDLSIAYTPGVAEPCLRIAADKMAVYEYTIKSNFVAIVSDGTAVLGLGDIGPEAAMPVMEGKCILFKAFGGVDAVPLCVDTKDPDEIVKLVTQLAPTFGGINLEDISGPRCFEIERKLKEKLNIPVFHDDQHGTAVVVLAALINSLKIVGKSFDEIKVVVNGAGAAGISVTRLLKSAGTADVILCDTKGAIYRGRPVGMNPEKEKIALETNLNNQSGSLADVLKGADVFIGVSSAGAVDQAMVKGMKPKAIIFALANPVPEIYPEEALAAGAAVVGTGRSDFPNQVNNVLAFPGIFRGALDTMATDINEDMKKAAAYAIAGMVTEDELNPSYVMPKAFDLRVGPHVAAAVAQAAVDSGIARLRISYEHELEQAEKRMGRQD
ncbi:MAG TPA: NAD-dependent malic enzyme [Peptococcaceae bacterium]|nr:NAD-dependent malic enzyme [Peptococcaceae bacterium]